MSGVDGFAHKLTRFAEAFLLIHFALGRWHGNLAFQIWGAAFYSEVACLRCLWLMCWFVRRCGG